jgi:hypothetical protein
MYRFPALQPSLSPQLLPAGGKRALNSHISSLRVGRFEALLIEWALMKLVMVKLKGNQA